ncbi:ferredoxin [Candidatus Parcubacteria bacterium]|nr:MAG: ferredoxin [Candidatus Parcubacteria bacterium]
MVKVTHSLDNCIGCGSCAAVCPKFWDMDYEKGKAVLKDGKKSPPAGGGEEFELEVTNEEDIKCNQEAADVCPTQVIKVIK